MTTTDEVMAVWAARYRHFLRQTELRFGFEKAAEMLHEIILYTTRRIAAAYDPDKGASLQTYMMHLFPYYIIDQVKRTTEYRLKNKITVLEFENGNAETCPARTHEIQYEHIDRERLAWCIDQLPQSDRIMLQQYASGWTMKEIGKSQGVSEAAISIRISKLKSVLKSWYDFRTHPEKGLSAPEPIMKARATRMCIPTDIRARMCEMSLAAIARRAGMPLSSLFEIVKKNYNSTSTGKIIVAVLEEEQSRTERCPVPESLRSFCRTRGMKTRLSKLTGIYIETICLIMKKQKYSKHVPALMDAMKQIKRENVLKERKERNHENDNCDYMGNIRNVRRDSTLARRARA